MVNKNELFYTEEHEWVAVLDEHTIRIGITEFAVNQLGDIVYVELPEVDDELGLEEEFATVESVKSTSGIYAPIAGVISKTNALLEDEPELLNESPLDTAWLVEMKIEKAVDTSTLLSLADYDKFIAE